MSDEEAIRRADIIKSEGNAAFKKQKYLAAIDRYTEAINIAPKWHVLYVNRALCHRRMGSWKKCEDDCRKALQLSGQLMKANYFLGVALRHLLEYEESALVLERALQAAREKGDSIKDEIWRELAACKFCMWKQASTARQARRKRVDARISEALQFYYLHHKSEDEATRANAQEEIAAVLEDAALRDSVREVDGAFACHLTMEPFRDPVCTPSGQSFERQALLQHFERNGHIDPITRDPIDPARVVSNIQLRNATQHYLDEHPWAWEECMDPYDKEVDQWR